MLDYSLYYPTVLPMRPPEPDGAIGSDDEHQTPVPVDLAVLEVGDVAHLPACTSQLRIP